MINKKNKILVADDEKEIREILKLLLTGEGYEVILAENGQQAEFNILNQNDIFEISIVFPTLLI